MADTVAAAHLYVAAPLRWAEGITCVTSPSCCCRFGFTVPQLESRQNR